MGTPTTIPAGLATWLGIANAAILYAAAIAQAVSGGDAAALGTAAGGLLSTLAVVGGRYAQAVSHVRTGVTAAADALEDLDLAELDADTTAEFVAEEI